MENIKKIKFESLESLRGLLSIFVCMAHAWQIFVNPVSGDYTSAHYVVGVVARFSVLCFFCLSGYVIALSIEKNILRYGAFNIRDYVLARVFRIWPPLLTVIVLTFILSIILSLCGMNEIPSRVPRSHYVVDVVAQLEGLLSFGLRGDLTADGFNGPLWTLKYEIQLYAISGLLACVFSPRGKLITRLVGFIIGSVVLFLYWKRVVGSLGGAHLSVLSVAYLSFAFGAMAYSLRRMMVGRKVVMIASLFGGIAAVVAYASSGSDILKSLDSTWLTFQLSISAFFAVCVAAVATGGGLRKLTKLGDYSYTLYICHYPMFLFVYFVLFHTQEKFLHDYPYSIAIFSVIAVNGISKTISHYVERSREQRNFFSARVRWLMV